MSGAARDRAVKSRRVTPVCAQASASSRQPPSSRGPRRLMMVRIPHSGGGADPRRAGLVASPHAGRDFMQVMPPDAEKPVILENQFRPVAKAAARAGRRDKTHDPATIMPSTRSEGAAMLRRMSISSARVMDMNMSFRLPAMVASAIGWVTLPLLIQKPPAPRL